MHSSALCVQAAASAPAGGELPDAWELLYASALMLARSAAVDELLGDHSKCIQDYSRCAVLSSRLAARQGQLHTWFRQPGCPGCTRGQSWQGLLSLLAYLVRAPS